MTTYSHPDQETGELNWQPVNGTTGTQETSAPWLPPSQLGEAGDEPATGSAAQSFLYRPPPAADTDATRPAEWGWRRTVNRLRLARLRPGAAELAHRHAVRAIAQPFPAARTVVVANPKGGAGKTPTALLLADLFAIYRRETAVAWDMNEMRGTLGFRAPVHEPDATVMDVLADVQHLAEPDTPAAAVGSYLRRQPSGALVLASSEDAREMRQLSGDQCRAVHRLLLRRYTSLVCDTGNNEAAKTFLAAVDTADVLVVPTAPRDDHLYAAGQMLEFLASREHNRHLLNSVVFVVTSDTGARLDPVTEQWWTQRVPHLLHVPADPAISGNGPIIVDELSEQSRRAWTHVTAAVARAAAKPSPHDAQHRSNATVALE